MLKNSKKIKLLVNIAFLIVAIVLIYLIFQLKMGLMGPNEHTQDDISTVLYIILSLIFIGNAAFSCINSSIKTKKIVRIILSLLLVIAIASSLALFLANSSHENFHRVGNFLYFAWASIYLFSFLATVFPLIQICRTLLTPNNK